MKPLFSALLFLLVVLLSACSVQVTNEAAESAGDEVDSTAASGEATGETIVHVKSAEEFDRLLKDNPVVMVDFYADWCGPCRTLAPTVAEVARDYQGKAVVAKVDTDDLGGLASKYGIRSIPNVKFFKNGEQVETLVGVREKSAYTSILDRLGG